MVKIEICRERKGVRTNSLVMWQGALSLEVQLHMTIGL